MAVTKPPLWNLDPASLADREGVGVLLKYPDPIPKVLPVEVIAQAIPHAGGSQLSGEGERTLLSSSRKSHIVHRGLVYCMSDRQPTPVDYRLSTMHAAAVVHLCTVLSGTIN